MGESWFRVSPGKKSRRPYLKQLLDLVTHAYHPSYKKKPKNQDGGQCQPGGKSLTLSQKLPVQKRVGRVTQASSSTAKKNERKKERKKNYKIS